MASNPPVVNLGGINLIQSTSSSLPSSSSSRLAGGARGVLITPLTRDARVNQPVTQSLPQSFLSQQASKEKEVVTPKPKPSVYIYKVRVYGGAAKRKYYVRDLHNVNEKFTSLERLVEVISSKLDLALPSDIGYFEGRSHSKKWLISDEDLEAMYARLTQGEVSLWYEEEEAFSSERQRSSDELPDHGRKKKKKASNKEKKLTKREQKEEEFEEAYLKLKDRHGDLLSGNQYRLWARTLVSGIHDDWETPPSLPMITGNPPKKPKQESLADALAGAATAVVKVLKESSTPTKATTSSENCVVGISPSKATDVRMKNLEQLRLAQRLVDEGIFTTEDFLEQKRCIMELLKKIS